MSLDNMRTLAAAASSLAAVALLTACQRAAPPASAAPPSQQFFRVVRAEFGLFDPQSNGVATFTPAKTVPFRVGQSYGRVVTVEGAPQKVRWREEFVLPSEPQIWASPASAVQLVSDDRRTSVTEREVAPVKGTIFNAWSIVEGDPKGSHLMRVQVQEGPPITFAFTVE